MITVRRPQCRSRAFGLLLCSLLLVSSSAFAQTTWIGANGDWATAGNWSAGVPNTSTDAIIANGGTATVSANGAAQHLVIGASAAGNLTLTDGTLAVGAHAYIGTSTGNGTATLSGGSLTTAGDFLVGFFRSGTLTVSGATLAVSGTSYLGYSSTSTATVSSGSWTSAGDLYIGVDAGESGTKAGTLTISGGTVSANAIQLATDGTSSGTINLNGGVLAVGAIVENNGGGGGHLNFNGGTLRATGHSGGFLANFEASDVQLLAGGGTIDTNGFNVTAAAALQGAGDLTKAGSGTLTLSGASTYTGATNVNAGTLALAGSSNIASSSLITVNTGGTLTAPNLQVGASGTGTEELSVAGGTVTVTAETYICHTHAGRATLSSGTWTSGGALYIGVGGANGELTLTGGTLSAAASAIAGAGLDTGTGSASVSGGTWTSTGALTVGYSGVGTLTVTGGTVNAASLRLSNDATGAGTINLDGGLIATGELIRGNGSGLFNFNGGTLRATGNNTGFTTGFSAGDLQISAGGAVIDTQAHAIAFSAVLQGSGDLTKTGSGTLTLSGANTYTGATNLNAGTLNLTGSIADSSLTTVGSGATLTGTGTLGALTVQTGGILAPGASPGTLNAGNTTFGPDGIFQFELNQAGSGVAGTNWDLLAITGTLAITATSSNPFVIDVASLTLSNVAGSAANFNSAASYTFIFATASGGITGFSADKFYIDTTDFANAFTEAWTVASDGNNLSLNYNVAPIPEPSAYAAVAGLLTLGMALRRRLVRQGGARTPSAP
jgi:autotransporter-associated beta strand protein/T5SS/PEP-CTERM-associated repeat protein